MSRLETRFRALRQQNRAGLVTFTMAGDPDLDGSLNLLRGLPTAGADVIEVGMPFSDPMADGPAIQAAGRRALKFGMTVRRTLELVAHVRANDVHTPIVLMGYYNPIYRFGPDRFVEVARAAGVDGLIVVDLPPEEDEELRPLAAKAGIDFIRLVAPTTGEARLERILAEVNGFIYYVAVRGITGAGSAPIAEIAEAVQRIRRKTTLPVAVGFGIRTPEQAAAVAKVADAAVVGSAIVERLAEHLTADGASTGAVAQALALVRGLARAVRAARVAPVRS